MKARFLSAAEQELAEAIEYYGTQAPGLGAIFQDEVEAAIRLVERHPLAWMSLSPRTRRCLLRRFPFGLFYQVRDKEILIVAVMDMRRDPQRWEKLL